MDKIKRLAWLNFIFFLIAFAISNLSQLKIFGGQTNADVSAKYETLFTPAGFTFAIWGVIYLALFGFTIYHLARAYKDNIHSESSQVLYRIDKWFIYNNIATALWVFAFTYEILLASVILILVQLFTLIKIFINLNLWDLNKTFRNKLFTQFPLSIYFAWLCVANVANISLYLVSVGWDGFGLSGYAWAIVMICIVSLLALYIIGFKRNLFFGLVVIWAFYGIYAKRKMIDADASELVMRYCWYGIMVVGTITLVTIINNWLYRRRQLNA